MFWYPTRPYLLVMVMIMQASLANQFTNDRKRPGPLVQAEHDCLQKFIVSENSIIRAQDSKVLGGEFLNYSDIGNREDCLAFCCSTKYCNVAVFQEKSPFSCYLFDCGRPEELLCKFASHTFYTSAVLAVNRHQLEIGEWSSEHQHETELAGLRSGGASVPGRPPNPTEPPKRTPSPLPTSGAVQRRPAVSQPNASSGHHPLNGFDQASKCSKYQFECKSGECIAIYNACDGVPQCKDASDEGQALGCPNSQLADSRPQTKVSQNAEVKNWNKPSETHAKAGYEQRPSALGYNNYRIDTPSHNFPGNSEGIYSPQMGSPDYVDVNHGRQMNSKYTAGAQEYGYREPLYYRDYPQNYNGPQSLPDYRSQYQPSSGPNQRQQESIGTNRVQDKHGPFDGAAQNDGHAWHRYNFPQPYNAQPSNPVQMNRNYYGDSVLNSYPQSYAPWPANEAERKGFPSGETNREQGRKPQLNQNAQIAHPPLQRPEPSRTFSNVKEARVNISSDARTGKGKASLPQQSVVNPLIGSKDPKPVHELQTSTTKPVPDDGSGLRGKDSSSVSTTRKPTDGHSAPKGSGAEPAKYPMLTVDLEELEWESETQSSQTSGAIIAVSLGLCITAVLALLIGCRARGMYRRGRRRRGLKSPLEHDADFLVNGLYL